MLTELRALFAEWLLGLAFRIAPETEQRCMARAYEDYFRLIALLTSDDEIGD